MKQLDKNNLDLVKADQDLRYNNAILKNELRVYYSPTHMMKIGKTGKNNKLCKTKQKESTLQRN